MSRRGVMPRQSAQTPRCRVSEPDGIRTEDRISGDPYVPAINSQTIISNKFLAVSHLPIRTSAPLANFYTEYPIFIARADSALDGVSTVMRRLKENTADLEIRSSCELSIGCPSGPDRGS